MALVRSGERIGDSLVVDRMLGEGAFAEVHRVEHRYLGWQAMKVFKRVASEAETRELLDEARLLSTLGHRHVIRLFDVGTLPTAEGRRGYFTMEYVPGGTLERFVAAHRPAVPTDVAAEVMTQIAAGLAVAHGQDPPVLHRDLTTANILVGYDGAGLRIRISDFGLAKRADPFTRLASAQGTYAFMAPEVMRSGGYSCAGDVWSVGVLAYLMLTDHLPYDDGAPFAPHHARFTRPLLPPSRYNETVDEELDRIVTGALTVDPWLRTPTARELGDALAARRVRAPVPAVTTAEPSPRARRLVGDAHELARTPGGLQRAADLLEEAIGLSPRLAGEHAHTLIRWRRGVVM
ncbi:serine/threonine-protein kinase [Cryptosporangium arvum]|uniref:serine/threonine-protein kinase n=1 Tax=Cryptosporangium arvum TaxID=80871 RepID=UPI0004AE6BFD|nr:serine/threonine-protein kinase [Cryptosporangium arvum]